MHTLPCWRRTLLAACLAGAAASAAAHDTWFEPLPAPRGGQRSLALGTGNQFPVHDSSIDRAYLREGRCRSADGAALALEPLRNTDTALLVHAPAAAVNCWAQLVPFEIELAADKVAVYLDEVRPPPAVLDAWSAIRARGLPWKERYTKHARIVLQASGSAAAAPSGMGMDVLLEGDAPALGVGQPLVFQVLRDGRPLADFNVELRNERTRFSLWRRTDAQGRLRWQPPLPGRWVLRGIDLRLAASPSDSWESRFVTLAFEVQSHPGSSFKFNALSVNQTAASKAIDSEPPTSTARR